MTVTEMKNKYHVSIKRKSLRGEQTSCFEFETPLSLKEILEQMSTDDSIDHAENSMIELKITNLNLKK